MAEEAPAAAPAVKAKAPRKKSASRAAKAGPSLSKLIITAVADSKERKGSSLVAIKKSLGAKGIDVVKANKRINTAVAKLVSKGELSQVKGCYKVAKKESKAAKPAKKATKKAPAKAKKPAAKKTGTPKKTVKKAKKPAAKKATTPKKPVKKPTKSPKKPKTAAKKPKTAAKKPKAAAKKPAAKKAAPKKAKK